MKKILLYKLAPALDSALSEQLSGFAVTRDAAAGPFDLVVGGEASAFPQCPVLELPGEEGPLRLGSLLAGIARRLAAPALHMKETRFMDWTFHPPSRRLEGADGRIVDLTDREADMLVYLLRRGGETVPREDLLREVWGYQEGVDTHTLETHVHRLRRKIGAEAIMTDGGGYRLCDSGGDAQRDSESGSVFLYILSAILLTAVVIFTLTAGPGKDASTPRLDVMSRQLYADLAAFDGAVMECTGLYPAPYDVDGDGDEDAADNPNAPFPLYNLGGTKGGSGGGGVTLNFGTNNIVCPGAPGMPDLFGPKNPFALGMINDMTAYDVHYRTDTTEGVLVRVSRINPDPLWDEAGARVNARLSDCKAAYVKDGVTDGGSCSTGCFFYWVLRLPSTAIATNDDGTDCTAP